MINSTIDDLDKNLEQVLKKNELDYMIAYNSYIKTKEKDLRAIIARLEAKNENTNVQEKKINQLEEATSKLRQEAFDRDQKE